MYCRNCGTPVIDGVEYCEKCAKTMSPSQEPFQPIDDKPQFQQPYQSNYQQPPIQQVVVVEQKKMGCWRAFWITIAVLTAITFFVLFVTGGCSACVAGFMNAASSN